MTKVIQEGWITSQEAVELTGYTAQYLRKFSMFAQIWT
jgi:hypothetical protein